MPKINKKQNFSEDKKCAWWEWRWTPIQSPDYNHEADVVALNAWLTPISQHYVFQLECGKEAKQLHYQGYVQLPNDKRVRAENDRWKRIQYAALPDGGQFHIAVCSTDKKLGECQLAIKNYCMKQDTRVAGPWGDKAFIPPVPEDHLLFPENITLLNLIVANKDPRKTTLIIDEKGGTGKTFTAKYLARNRSDEVILVNAGRLQDMMEVVYSKGQNKKIYIVNKPRTLAAEAKASDLSSFFEQISDGDITKTKGLVVHWHQPRARGVLLCNGTNDWKGLSLDRFLVYDYVDGKYVRVHPGPKKIPMTQEEIETERVKSDAFIASLQNRVKYDSSLLNI